MRSFSVFFLWLGIWSVSAVTVSALMPSIIESGIPQHVKAARPNYIYRKPVIRSSADTPSVLLNVTKKGMVADCDYIELHGDEKKYVSSSGMPEHKTWIFVSTDPTKTVSLYCYAFSYRRCKTTGVTFFGVFLFERWSKHIARYYHSHGMALAVHIEVRYPSDNPLRCFAFLLGDAPQADPEVCSGKCGIPLPPPSRLLGSLDNPKNRIANGRQTYKHQFPWMVYLRMVVGSKTPFGGGVLICSQYILTAAHKVDKLKYWQFEAVIGAHNYSDPIENVTQVLHIIKIHLHPEYRNGYIYHDLALLRLVHPVKYGSDANYGKIKPICLPPSTLNITGIGKRVFSAGWGGNDSDTISAKPQFGEFHVLTEAQCKALHPKIPDLNKLLCMQGKVDTPGGDADDVCWGDGGGGIFLRTPKGVYFLIGIVAFGHECNSYQFGSLNGLLTQEVVAWIIEKSLDCTACTIMNY